MEHFGINVGVAYMNVQISKQLKEELAWAIDKQLLVISNKMFNYTTTILKNKAIIILYAMWPLVTCSN